MSDRATIGKFRDLATEAVSKGRYDQALKCYLELERLDPDPDWPRRAAGMYKRLGKPKEELDALNRATREYVRRGDIMKAVAASKQILAIDPRHQETLRRLPNLRTAFESGAREAPQMEQLGSVVDAGGAQPSRPAPKDPNARPAWLSAGASDMVIERQSDPKTPSSLEGTLDTVPRMPAPPGASSWLKSQDSGLMTLPLKDVVPGAASSARTGVYQIPLEDEITEDKDFELSFEEPLHVSMARESGVAIDSDGNVKSAQTAPAETAEDLAFEAVAREMRMAEKANTALSKSALFADLPKKTFSELLLNARLVEIEDKQELFKQGDKGDALYVIAEGKVGVVDEGPPRRGIARLEPGDYFGEIALVTDQPRTATIVALADSILIAIDRAVIRKVLISDAAFLTQLLRMLRNRLVDRLLSTNPLFVSLSARDRDLLKPRFRFLEVEPGALLLTEGKRPAGLVIILAGNADVYRVQNDKEVMLGELRIGDVCGETALLTGINSFANVRAKTKCLAIELPAAFFEKIVTGRPDAMAFIKEVMNQRIAKSQAILSGKATYAEGRLTGM